MKSRFTTSLMAACMLLAACAQTTNSPASDPPPTSSVSDKPAAADKPNPLEGSPEPAEVAGAPIEVTYFTPAQGEGPYYPVDKPEDSDNDLTALDGAGGAPIGQIIEFYGTVYDSSGVPIPALTIEIWQTDHNGVYLHPNDPGTDGRDRNFQFYGEAITSADGRYAFRTILPGQYEPRPRHIHVKVKHDGSELLTTQFYFQGDEDLEAEAMFNQVGGQGAHLIINLAEGQDASGNPILTGERDIILNGDLSS